MKLRKNKQKWHNAQERPITSIQLPFSEQLHKAGCLEQIAGVSKLKKIAVKLMRTRPAENMTMHHCSLNSTEPFHSVAHHSTLCIECSADDSLWIPLLLNSFAISFFNEMHESSQRLLAQVQGVGKQRFGWRQRFWFSLIIFPRWQETHGY